MRSLISSEVHDALLALESEATLSMSFEQDYVWCPWQIRNQKQFFGMIATFAKKKTYMDEKKWKTFEIEALIKGYDHFLLYAKRYFPEEKHDFYERMAIFDLSSRSSTLFENF